MVKRALDIVVSLILLILFSPLMLVLAVIIALDMGRPAIFRQKRPGLHGKLFTMYKFRTMTGSESVDDIYRLTPISSFIRNASLDELPTLFNVLKGDMSLVGPRPLMPQYLTLYTPEQARRHEVRPGITGLAQASGRRNLPFSKRLELDVYYVDHRSLWLDMKILLLTIPSVLFARGAKELGAEVVDDLGLLASLDSPDGGKSP
jgi:sugar transferase EpsL